MCNTFGGDERIGNLLYVLRLASQYDHLQAIVMIQMDVESRHDAFVMLVLQFRQLFTQQPHVVVVDDGHRSYDCGVGFLSALLHQFGARQIAKGFRSIGIAPSFHQLVELIEKLAFNRNAKAPQIGHRK
jgi:hypothetical protein